MNEQDKTNDTAVADVEQNISESEAKIETESAKVIPETDSDSGNTASESQAEEVGKEKLAGISKAAFSEEKMRQAIINGENSLEAEQKAAPAFFVKGTDTETIEVDVLTHPQTGRVMSVTKSGYGIDFETEFAYFVHSVLRFEFSIPNYIQLSEYRRRCTTLDDTTDKPIIDRVKLREFFLVNHLKNWNLVDTDGHDIPLTFDKSGLLSDLALVVAHSLAPAILDVVFTIFEKDVLLI